MYLPPSWVIWNLFLHNFIVLWTDTPIKWMHIMINFLPSLPASSRWRDHDIEGDSFRRIMEIHRINYGSRASRVSTLTFTHFLTLVNKQFRDEFLSMLASMSDLENISNKQQSNMKRFVGK